MTLSLEGRSAHVHCLRNQIRRQDPLPGLEEAIALARVAVDLRPEGHFHRSDSLHQLALRRVVRRTWFHSRFGGSYHLGRAALKLCPPGDSCRAAVFSNLAMSLKRGFLDDSEEVDLVSQQRLHHLPHAPVASCDYSFNSCSTHRYSMRKLLTL